MEAFTEAFIEAIRQLEAHFGGEHEVSHYPARVSGRDACCGGDEPIIKVQREFSIQAELEEEKEPLDFCRLQFQMEIEPIAKQPLDFCRLQLQMEIEKEKEPLDFCRRQLQMEIEPIAKEPLNFCRLQFQLEVEPKAKHEFSIQAEIEEEKVLEPLNFCCLQLQMEIVGEAKAKEEEKKEVKPAKVPKTVAPLPAKAPKKLEPVAPLPGFENVKSYQRYDTLVGTPAKTFEELVNPVICPDLLYRSPYERMGFNEELYTYPTRIFPSAVHGKVIITDAEEYTSKVEPEQIVVGPLGDLITKTKPLHIVYDFYCEENDFIGTDDEDEEEEKKEVVSNVPLPKKAMPPLKKVFHGDGAEQTFNEICKTVRGEARKEFPAIEDYLRQNFKFCGNYVKSFTDEKNEEHHCICKVLDKFPEHPSEEELRQIEEHIAGNMFNPNGCTQHFLYQGPPKKFCTWNTPEKLAAAKADYEKMQDKTIFKTMAENYARQLNIKDAIPRCDLKYEIGKKNLANLTKMEEQYKEVFGVLKSRKQALTKLREAEAKVALEKAKAAKQIAKAEQAKVLAHKAKKN